MLLIWIGLLIELLIWNLFFPLIQEPEGVAFLLISIHTIFVFIYILRYPKFYQRVFYFAYALRLGAMLWDIYFSYLFLLPNSGQDSVAFFNMGVSISQNIKLLEGSVYGGLYSKILGGLFYYIGTERMIVQYINVLLGITTLIILYKILQKLCIDDRIMKKCMVLMAIFPNAIIFSGICLREAFIATFVTISIWFFVKWYAENRYICIVQSTLCLLVASAFHSGVIGFFAGYAFFYLFYNQKAKVFIVKKTTWIRAIGIGTLIFCIGYLYSNIFFWDFIKGDAIRNLYETASKSSGGAAYLTDIQITSIYEFIFFLPVKIAYFLTSPLPMNWRGLTDIIAFLTDGLLYMTIIIYSVLNRKLIKQNPIAIAFILMIICTSCLYGLGVSNAGTAMRHRHKILSAFIILQAILMNSKYHMRFLKSK